MKSGHKLMLAALLAAAAPCAGIAAEPYGYGNCRSFGCNAACPPNYYQWRDHSFACGPLGWRTYCCEPMGFISQAQKRKSPNSAKVIKATPRPKYTPDYTFTPNYSSAKVIKAVPRPNYTPKYQLPRSTNKVPASARVIKAAPRPASYTPKYKFPKLYGSPLR